LGTLKKCRSINGKAHEEGRHVKKPARKWGAEKHSTLSQEVQDGQRGGRDSKS